MASIWIFLVTLWAILSTNSQVVMDLIETNTFFIVVNGSQALYCDRLAGKLTVRHASEVFNEWNPVCLGKIDGVIGKIRYHPDSDWRLYLISESKPMGKLPDGLEVRRISRVTILVLNTSPIGELNLSSCTRSHPDIPKKNMKSTIFSSPQRPFMKIMQKRVLATETRDPRWRLIKRREKYEQRIEEELVNMLQSEDESYFYFSPGGGDLTNWTQCKTHPSYWSGVPENTDVTYDNSTIESQPLGLPTSFKPSWRQPVWRRADQRFFWNSHLLSEPIVEADRMLTSCGFPVYGANFKSSESFTQFNSLIADLEGLLMPIVQGYVHIEEFVLNRLQGHLIVDVLKKSKTLTEKSNNDLPSMSVAFFNNHLNINDEQGQINIIGLSGQSNSVATRNEHKNRDHFDSVTYHDVDASLRQAVEFDPSVFSSSTSSTRLMKGRKRMSFAETSQLNDMTSIPNQEADVVSVNSTYNSVAADTLETTTTSNMTSSAVTVIPINNTNNDVNNSDKNNFSQQQSKPMIIGDVEHVTVILFSRRSCRRAGTRYRRRGIDADGYVANYVETEQILHTNIDQFPHTVAFLQCRGSVPLYWSQTGLVYNPPILLEKTQEENQEAFNKYWSKHFQEYERILIVNLLSSGRKHRETILTDAFVRHILLSKNERLAYINFDFHDFCRNSQFQNASVLLTGIADLFRNFKYCWLTRNGMICEQKWIFHVNCLDCLDRTNLVQCMFAVVMITTQLKKIGLLGPEECLPTEFLRTIQHMWATNGDAISQIYAGTGAMKGDYTRTGSRTVNGLMRDGVYSVSRYYLRLREINRQAAIDLFIGNEQSSEMTMFCNGSGLESASLQVRQERIKLLISRCQELLIQPNEKYFSECLLVSYSEFIRDIHYVNTVALITDKYLHFIKTDFNNRNNRPAYIRIPLEAIEKLEFGLEPAIFRAKHFVLRIFYKVPDENSIQRSDSLKQQILGIGSDHVKTSSQQTLTSSAGQQTRSQSSDLSLSPVKRFEKPKIPISSQNDQVFRASGLFGRIAHVSTTSFIPNDKDVNETRYKLNVQTDRSNSERNLSEHERDVSSGGCPGGGGGGSGRNNTGIRNFRQAIKMPKVTHNFLEFLQPDTRLFNTVLVPVPPGDESLQALRVVASTILISLHSIGRYLELTETKPPNKLERLRQAGVPKEYQPSINLHTLGSGLRGMGRRRESVVSLRSRYRISRATSIQDAVLDTDGGVVMINPDVNIDDQNAKNQVSLAKMNTNTIKQRLKQIKFPKLPFNFGRHMRSTSGQSRAEEVQIIPEKFNNLKQEKDEPDSEIADCRQFCSPKFKLKRNNNNRIYVGADVDYDDADDDDLDEEDDETENSDAMDSEEDIALSDEDSVSEDSQLANKMSTLYQYSKYPAFRRSTYHGVHESSGCEQAIQSSPLSSGSVLRTPHYKRYSHSESDINKRMTALSSSCDLIGHEQKKQSETPLKLLKKSIRESYQAISKSKLSLQLSQFQNTEDNSNESASVEKITPQLTNRLLNPSVNDRQINLQTVTLEELLYGSRVVSASRSGSIRGGSVSHIEKGNNTAGKTMSTTSDSNYILEINDQPILLDYLNNKAIYERLQQLFKHYTQQSIMNSVLFYTEYNNPINTFTTNSVIDTLSQSVNSEFNTPIIHDYGLYELLQQRLYTGDYFV